MTGQASSQRMAQTLVGAAVVLTAL
ncbi:MAG: hypothetical protein K0R89_1960, partial [Ramlibacter sp.]|nr:hypothetical protein [Ramlibacter sp.]